MFLSGTFFFLNFFLIILNSVYPVVLGSAYASALRGCFVISTLFSPINSNVLHLIISGLSRKLLFTILLERKSTLLEKKSISTYTPAIKEEFACA
jgi:hypothetical protein